MSITISYANKVEIFKEEPSPVGRLKIVNNLNDPIYSRILENQLTIEKSALYKKRMKNKIKEEIKEEIRREINKEKEKCI